MPEVEDAFGYDFWRVVTYWAWTEVCDTFEKRLAEWQLSSSPSSAKGKFYFGGEKSERCFFFKHQAGDQNLRYFFGDDGWLS